MVYLTAKAQLAIKAYLEKEDVTLVFEVIDPVRDPHIIKYDKEDAVLLDIVHNTWEFKKKDFEELSAFAERAGLTHKLVYREFENDREFFKWYTENTQEDDLSKTDVEVNFDNLSQELNDRADTCASNFNSTGKTNLSSFGMPSGKCITLTAGASGTKYTAPANGWVSFCVEGNANGLFGLNNLTITDSARISTFIPAPAKGVTYRTFMPIMKNSEFSIEFYNSITPQWLVFIYAQGEV